MLLGNQLSVCFLLPPFLCLSSPDGADCSVSRQKAPCDTLSVCIKAGPCQKESSHFHHSFYYHLNIIFSITVNIHRKVVSSIKNCRLQFKLIILIILSLIISPQIHWSVNGWPQLQLSKHVFNITWLFIKHYHNASMLQSFRNYYLGTYYC